MLTKTKHVDTDAWRTENVLLTVRETVLMQTAQLEFEHKTTKIVLRHDCFLIVDHKDPTVHNRWQAKLGLEQKNHQEIKVVTFASD